MDCNSLITSLDWCEGAPSLAGIRRRAYIAPKRSIVKMPVLPKDKNGRVTDSTYVGDFMLKADAKWAYVEFNPDQSQHTSEAENEIPSQLQKNKLVLVCPGAGPKETKLVAEINNNNCIVVWQDMNGRWRVTGSNLYHNKCSAAQDNGQGPTGTVSTTITVEAHDYIPSPFYVGKLDTEDGEVDCASEDVVDLPGVSD